ncbi:ATPase [Halobaculum sp. WSA2]|uniref:ATPase n=1 Tax=Halobaculum saliterrae TaxID=2073113 RepID=A0A6B0T1E9_9EURY|nr:ATPase [Halobaculum saliterrae]MXR42462.1 ATPase [Halobaculum saliterrae]
MHVIGTEKGGTGYGCEPESHDWREPVARDGAAPVAPLGRFRATDDSVGARVAVDIDGPHAALVVGKRGSGKTHTLAVLAEGVAAAEGLAPVAIDPMGVLAGLAADGGTVHRRPRVKPDAVPPPAWPALLDLDPAGAVGSLVWRAVAESSAVSIAAAREYVADADAARATRRAADTHLALAAEWDAFDPDGLAPRTLATGEPTVLDCSGLPQAAAGAVCAAVARGLYDARGRESIERLPWLFVDEAHAFFDGVAGDALATLLTRGRTPGVSLACATQRPAALPPVAVSQADLLVAHRLHSRADIDTLAAARPLAVDDDLGERLPTGVGEALVVDDATETATAVRIRERRTPDYGVSPRASDRGRGGTDGESCDRADRCEPDE